MIAGARILLPRIAGLLDRSDKLSRGLQRLPGERLEWKTLQPWLYIILFLAVTFTLVMLHSFPLMISDPEQISLTMKRQQTIERVQCCSPFRKEALYRIQRQILLVYDGIVPA